MRTVPKKREGGGETRKTAGTPEADRYRLIAEHCTDMISTHTPEGVYTYVSPACRALLGYEPEDLVGRSAYELFHTEDLEAIRSTHTSITHRPDVYTIAYRIRKLDGTFTWFETTCKTIRDGGNGAVREIIGVSRDVSDRKVAQQQLTASQGFLQAILDKTSAVIYVKQYRGADGAYLLINRTYEQLFGVDRGTFLGRNDLELFPREMAEAFRAVDLRVFRTGRAEQLEEVAPHADGLHTYISVKFPLTDDRGQIYAVCGISTDITERKRAEQAREDSWRLARNILDSSSTRTAVIGEDGRIRHVNRAWMEFGASLASPAAAIGVGADYLAACDRAAAVGLPSAAAAGRALREVLAGSRREVGVEYACPEEGADRWYLAQFSSFAEPGDARVLVAHLDISEQKRVENTLREVVERFNLMVDGSQQGLWDATVNQADPYNSRNPIYWSARLKQMLGYQEHEFENVIGSWSSLLHPDDAPRVFAALDAHLYRRVPYDVEYRLQVKDGGWRWFAARGQAIWDAQGRPLRISGSLADITDRKSAEENARHLQSEISHVSRLAVAGEMSAELAHEINQPLAAISGYTAAARLGLRSVADVPAEVLENIRKCEEQARRAGQIIRHLAGFVRKREPRRSTVCVNEIISAVESLSIASARHARGGVKFELTPDLPLVLADRIQIQQVLLNLVRNAADALEACNPPCDEPIVVRTTRAAPGVIVAVEDRGPGISAEILPQVFQAFFTTKPTGMGLGLAISRTIIESHGGRLWAESNSVAPDKSGAAEPAGRTRGTVFKFTVPAVPGDQSHVR